MTFQNTAGPQKHQAVALCSDHDRSMFYRCSFKGHQDTLYVYSQCQFYTDCDVYGTVDFIFGDAAVVFQNHICEEAHERPAEHGDRPPMRTPESQSTTLGSPPPPTLKAVQGSFKTYLGRPWQKYSWTVFMKTFLDSLIAPQGWSEWSGNFAFSTLYYGEYVNTGGGAGTSSRVKWPGFHVITSAAEAGKFTVGSFLGGSS
eukprot:TRINITY_DN22917_c0_g1_i1.p1 TRINITY_DN22917_c0_g1~~TRINITY_DN22917_c0_g1_i1.p1  ORF type:complete len:214 (+),score=7.67 TRINITY_DN22917_c0_g1_i1:40-642(+)